MSVNKKFFEIAHERMSRRRTENKRTEDRRRAEIHNKIPEYSELECSIANNMGNIISAISQSGPEAEKMIRQAINDNLETQQKMSALLKKNGYPEDYLNPIFTCSKCKDTGSVNGQWCECFNKLLNAAAAEEFNSHSPLQLNTFDSFDLKLYPDKLDPVLQEKQRDVMENNFNECVSFARSFNGKGYGMLLIGNTGLGKTHLSLAIAKEVIDKGFSVVYGSVPDLIRNLDKEQFNKKEGDTMELVTDCDLLILDDLGAENSTNRSVPQLYEIINARQSRLLPMIVNSNLNMKEIKSRYNDRLWSRLFSMRVLLFCGEDNRLKISNN